FYMKRQNTTFLRVDIHVNYQTMSCSEGYNPGLSLGLLIQTCIPRAISGPSCTVFFQNMHPSMETGPLGSLGDP
ncbi:Uncharacterized protein FKW44_000824, partial [Caligus rogercresseyi]